MSTVSILTKTDIMQQDVKTESIVYPNGVRRESAIFPNGVRKDYITYPDGRVKESITYENRPNVGQFATGVTIGQVPPDGHRVYPVDEKYPNDLAAHKAPTGRRSPPRKSVVDYLAPPIKRTDPTVGPPKCCFCLNVRVGAAIVAFIELGLLALALYGVAHFFIDTASDPQSVSRPRGGRVAPTISRNGLLVGFIVTAIFVFFVILFLLYGLWKKNVSFMIPHLVIQALAVLAAFVGIILTSIAISIMRPRLSVKGNYDDENDLSDKDSPETYYFCVGVLVFCIFVFLLEIYGFLPIRQCARFYNIVQQDTASEEMAERAVSSYPASNPPWHMSVPK